MAGKGPLPKPEHRRARKGGHVSMRVVVSAPVEQPPLPRTRPDGSSWPPETLDWWRMWGEDPLSGEFRATDWSELLDTALIHAAVWCGELRLAPELRLRTARMGATAEDRARLRIQFAAADVADPVVGGESAEQRARARYNDLRVIE